LFYFPRSVQQNVLNTIGRNRYGILPKPGTNPRGVEISSEALNLLASHQNSLQIPIKWDKKTIEYNPYERWLALWERD
jgi:hypothetical protein